MGGKLFSLKGNEILTPAATWMNLEAIMPSGVSQTEKDKSRMIPLVGGPSVVQFIAAESKIVVTRGWGRREWGAIALMGTEF